MHNNVSFSSSVPASSADERSFQLAAVEPSGDVSVTYSARDVVSCIVDTTNWPYDSHTCTAIYASVLHSGRLLDLEISDLTPQARNTFNRLICSRFYASECDYLMILCGTIKL